MLHLADSYEQLDGLFSRSFAPREELGLCDWGAREIKPPNSARTGTGSFDLDATPWLKGPAEAAGDLETRELVMLAPTGGSKTTLADLVAAHEIAEGGGSVLVSMQSDPEAAAYWDERLEPILKGIEKVRVRIESLPKGKVKKGEVKFPGQTIYVQGNHKNVFQRKSCRVVILDEAWMIKHGLMVDARERTHKRWNRLVMIISQGGDAKMTMPNGDRANTELEDAWRRSDMQEFSMVCPECQETHRWHRNNLLWVSQKREDGSYDEGAQIQSTRYRCPGKCQTQFEDTPAIRWALTNGSVYVPSNANYVPHPQGHHHGFHVPASAMPHESWADLGIQWTRAAAAWKRGDKESKKTFIQKRDAENFLDEQDEEPKGALTHGMIVENGEERKYRLADYLEGQPWEGEAIRIATIDRQRDHFWLVIRAWKADGSSRRLYVGKLNTFESVLDRIAIMKVKPEAVFQDARWEPDDVYNDCGRNGWTALIGDIKANSYPFPARNGERLFYSPVRYVTSSSGKPAQMRYWANLPIKRMLEKFRGAYREGQPWEVEGDITPLHVRHLFSEIERDVVSKVTKQVTRTFVKRHKDNHTWDCEAMQIVGALGFGMLADAPDAADEKLAPAVNE